MTKNQTITLGAVLPAALILTLAGGGGLAFVFLNTQPFLGPRWLLFFFASLLACGVSLPLFTILHKRFSKKGISESVLVREVLLFAIYIDLLLWLQLGRVLNDVVVILLGMGFILLEIFLRISERAVFNPNGDQHD
jgi:glucan phosphoethanolaminetransferase (alkaline phosphatase superfamily)